MYKRTNNPAIASNPDIAAHNLAPTASGVCHHAVRGYFEALRQIACETNGIAMLDNANSASKNPPNAGSWIPQPTTVQAALAFQTTNSGAPTSQNAHQRATLPAANRAKNFMGQA